MARTRDPRPSSDGDGEQQHFTAVHANGRDNHRIYEENELSAAEALMGINASPTASHPNGTRSASASISSNTTPANLISQRQAASNDKTRPQRGTSATSSMSLSKGRRRNRGKGVSAPNTSNSEGDEAHRSLNPDENNILYGVTHVETAARPIAVRREQPERVESNDVEDKDVTPKALSKGRQKRKRSESVSVAAVSRGRMNGTEGPSGMNGEDHGDHPDVPEPIILSTTESKEPDALQVVEHRAQNEVGGPANPKTEATMNGSNERKSKLRNFDKVVFGQWLIKTWYYSPYPIWSNEDDNTSATVTSGRHTATTTASARGRHSRGGNVRARPHPQNTQEDNDSSKESLLWVCEKCFKYMQDGKLFELHERFCNKMSPPGEIVYKRGGHVIYEIDGAKDKLYCQNLSLFGKLFIDIKTVFYDCENFMFYVLTESDRQQDHVMGFFSKEKISYDDYNLACIITFPPYQRRRYGMLMIEFSYYLSRREGKLGTPERPLSELGLRTYLTYWTNALVQFFRRILSVQPLSDMPRKLQRLVDDDLIRFIEAQDPTTELKKRRKSGKSIDSATRARIWDSALENKYYTQDVVGATSGANDVLYNRMRWMRTSVNPDGSATIHVFAKCTLQDIANATGIRTEDVAFTLHECGLLQRIQALDREEMEEVIVISREMIEQVARECKVKDKMCMEVQYVL